MGCLSPPFGALMGCLWGAHLLGLLGPADLRGMVGAVRQVGWADLRGCEFFGLDRGGGGVAACAA